MRSSAVGKSILKVEVENISSTGIWLLTSEREYFLPYDEFPWFKTARISDVINVELPFANHLHWPTLDVDIELESLENQKSYPLIYH